MFGCIILFGLLGEGFLDFREELVLAVDGVGTELAADAGEFLAVLRERLFVRNPVFCAAVVGEVAVGYLGLVAVVEVAERNAGGTVGGLDHEMVVEAHAVGLPVGALEIHVFADAGGQDSCGRIELGDARHGELFGTFHKVRLDVLLQCLANVGLGTPGGGHLLFKLYEAVYYGHCPSGVAGVDLFLRGGSEGQQDKREEEKKILLHEMYNV